MNHWLLSAHHVDSVPHSLVGDATLAVVTGRLSNRPRIKDNTSIRSPGSTDDVVAGNTCTLCNKFCEKIIFPLPIVYRRKKEEEVKAERSIKLKKIRRVSLFVSNSLLQTDPRRFMPAMKSFRLIGKLW